MRRLAALASILITTYLNITVPSSMSLCIEDPLLILLPMRDLGSIDMVHSNIHYTLYILAGDISDAVCQRWIQDAYQYPDAYHHLHICK